MKPIAICGGALAFAVLAALALTAGGCQSHLFSKKDARRTEAAATESRGADKSKDVHRRELDELLSIE